MAWLALARAVQDNRRRRRAQPVEEPATKPAHMRQPGFHLLMGQAQRRREANRQEDRLGAWPPALLLVAAPEAGPQWAATADQQSTDALGAVKLVRRERHACHAEVMKAHWHLAHCLRRVAVEPLRIADCGLRMGKQIRNRLYNSG